MSEEQNISKVIILNCFGRGGSNIVWNIIGGSPDVLMPNAEWHKCFYGENLIIGRALRKITRPWTIDVPCVPGLTRRVKERTLAAISDQERQCKRDASSIVVKLMDHHICMNTAIRQSFPLSEQVILARHPVAQCESLLRSGLNLEQAVSWYMDVCQRYARLLKTHNAHIIKFEDVVRDPFGVRDSVYHQLGIKVPDSGAFRIKQKKFGDSRTSNSDAIGNNVSVTKENVHSFIDATVNVKAIARVSEEAQAYIWARTGALVRVFGYEQDVDTTCPQQGGERLGVKA